MGHRKGLKDISGIRFEDLFQLEDIQRLQDEFSAAMGVAGLITLPDGTPLTRPSAFSHFCANVVRASKKGCENCQHSDAVIGKLCVDGPTVQHCLSGCLWDAGAGISVGGTHVANWLIGQVRDESVDIEQIRSYARLIGVDENEAEKAYMAVPAMSQERFSQIAQALFSFANQLSKSAYLNLQLDQHLMEKHRFEQELIASKLQAEKASQAKTDFLTVMSHEMRTPMNMVMGLSDILIESCHDKTQLEQLQRLKSAGTSLLHLIDNVLDISTIEQGEIKIHKQDFHLKRLLEEVASLFDFSFQEKGISFSFRIDSSISEWVHGDMNHIRQILFNLLSNALKFTDSGIVELAAYPNGLQAEIEFSVRDTGKGIDQSVGELIFDKFEQEDQGMTRSYGGCGLGLSISRRLVELQGGKIWYESEKGQGSCFLFSLPLLSVDFGGLRTIEKKRSHLKRQNIRILLVEDSEDNRMLINLFLRKDRVILDMASNGEEALQKLAENEYDLILMDIQMPIMDGYTCTLKIREREKELRKEAVPIIALTAHALASEKIKSLDVGCNAHVTKPIKRETLFEMINEFAS